jgi:hypothetical protein
MYNHIKSRVNNWDTDMKLSFVLIFSLGILRKFIWVFHNWSWRLVLTSSIIKQGILFWGSASCCAYLIKVNRRNPSLATIFQGVFNFIFTTCRYMFRPFLAIFRRKYTIIISESYLNYNGSVGFLLAPIYYICKLWNLKNIKMFFCFFLGFLLRFINILMSCCCLVTSRYLFYSVNSSPVLSFGQHWWRVSSINLNKTRS